MCLQHNAIDFVFVLDIVILYFLAISFRWYAIFLIVIYYIILKFTLKHLKAPTWDPPPCKENNVHTQHAATSPMDNNHLLTNNFSKEHCTLPDNDLRIETCRSF
jgi:hypothetical protein